MTDPLTGHPDPGGGIPGRAAIPVLSRPVIVGGIVVGVVAVSFAAILIRIAEAPSLSLAFWRCAGGALALAPFAARRPVLPSRSERRQLGWSGVFLAAHFALFISSLSFTTVASSVVLVAASPLFVGIGAAVFLGEPPRRRTWWGVTLAAAGAVVIGVADASGAPFGGRALLGDALAFGGAATVSGYLLLGRAARRHLPVLIYATWVYAVGAAVLLVACLATGSALVGYDTVTWLAIAGLIVGPQLLGHTVFNALLSTLPATVVAVAVLAEPVGAGLLAWLLLAELPTGGFWLGAPLVLAGVWLAASRSHPPPA